MENENKILAERKSYYSNIFCLFEILKCLKFRECAFITPKGFDPKKVTRYCWANNLDYLKSHMNWAKFFLYPLNMYCSVATMKDNVPIFTYDLRKRKYEEKYKEFNDNFINYVNGYDMFFDFDGKDNFERCYRDAKKFKEILDEYKIPYFLQNSSFNGFHFVILNEFMPKKDLDAQIVELNFIIQYIKAIYGLETLDPMVIDPKRLRKLPYSYECSGSIVLPLSDEQFIRFKPENVSFLNVMAGTKIKNRGLLIRTHNLDSDTLKQNVIRFLNEHKYK